MNPFRNNSKGKVVVITGGTAGIGRASARMFAARGYQVGVLARGLDGLRATKRELEAVGAECAIAQVDVANAAAVESAADQFEQELGPIDVWVNNAMASVFSPISEMTAEEFRRVTEVTYLGYVHGSLSALKRFRVRDKGTIVQVSSALAYRAIPLQSAYCAGKHAIKGFTESLITELMHDGSNVHVGMVNLPALNTPQFGWVKSRLDRKAQPVPPIFQPEVAARAVVYMAEHRRRAIDVGFPATKTIVGNKLLPWVADWYLAKKGYDAQQYDGHEDPKRPSNLWRPVPGDHGAHGGFDDRAKAYSIHATLNRHRAAIAGGVVVAAGAAIGGILAGRGNARELRRAA